MTNEVAKRRGSGRCGGKGGGKGREEVRSKERIVIQSHFYALQIFILVICIIAAVCLKTTPHYVYVIKIVTDKTLIKKRYPKSPLPVNIVAPDLSSTRFDSTCNRSRDFSF